MFVNGQAAALQAELAAMHHIATALGPLDESARARVLQWASQRLQADVPTPATPAVPTALVTPRPLAAVPPRPAPDAVPDEALSVTALEDMFAPAPAAPAAAAEPAATPVVGLLHEFVVEFQNIARDWTVASADPDDRAADQRASSAA